MLDSRTRRSLERVKLREACVRSLPGDVESLLADEQCQSNGDLDLAVLRLRDRLITDPNVASERASLVCWLVHYEAADRLLRRGWRADAHNPPRWCPPESFVAASP